MKSHSIGQVILTREHIGENGIVGKLTAWNADSTMRLTFPVTDADGMTDQVGRLAVAEKLWRDNARSLSCIPAGEYTLEKRTHGSFAEKMKDRFNHEFVPWIRGCEPARTDILFHPGNDPETDSEGCILPGMSKNIHAGNVGRSADAHKALYKLLAAAPDDNWPIKFVIVDATTATAA